jgi:hypothetical protein
VQRFGDALNLNVHFHPLVLNGVYLEQASGTPRFRLLPPPSDEEVAGVVATFARRLCRLLQCRGFFEPECTDADPLGDETPLLAELAGASVRGRIATGHRAGQPVLRLGDRIDVDDLAELSGPRCASLQGITSALFPQPIACLKPISRLISENPSLSETRILKRSPLSPYPPRHLVPSLHWLGWSRGIQREVQRVKRWQLGLRWRCLSSGEPDRDGFAHTVLSIGAISGMRRNVLDSWAA